jgi:hypothetical protein
MMIGFIVFPWTYALLFIILVLGWPFVLLDSAWVFGLYLFVNTAIFITVVRFTSSRQLSFWRGLRLLCGSYMSGCANITMIYIFPVLLFYYIRAIAATWTGIQTRKDCTEDWWIETISSRLKAGSQR